MAGFQAEVRTCFSRPVNQSTHCYEVRSFFVDIVFKHGGYYDLKLVTLLDYNDYYVYVPPTLRNTAFVFPARKELNFTCHLDELSVKCRL